MVYIFRSDGDGWVWEARKDDGTVTGRSERGYVSYADVLREAQLGNGTLLPTTDPDVYEVLL